MLRQADKQKLLFKFDIHTHFHYIIAGNREKLAGLCHCLGISFVQLISFQA